MPGCAVRRKTRLPPPTRRRPCRPQNVETFCGILSVLQNEPKPSLLRGERRSPHVNPQHPAKEGVFALTLMSHLLQNAQAAGIGRVRPDGQILVAEHAPHAHYFEPLGFVRVHQESIAHKSYNRRWTTMQAWDTDRATSLIQELQQLPGALLPMLHALQEEFGYIDEAAVPLIADALNISKAEVHGVISFYHDFRHEPPGRHTLKMCRAEVLPVHGLRPADRARREAFGSQAGRDHAPMAASAWTRSIASETARCLRR